MQKCTKYVKYAGCLFLYLRHARIEPSNKRRIVWQKIIQRFRLQILSTEKMNKRKVTVQYFACLVLVAIVAIEFI